MKLTFKIVAVTVLIVFSSGMVLAQEFPDPDDQGGGSRVFTIPNPLSCANFQDCLGRIIQGLIVLAAPVLVVMVIVGAYQILTGGAEPENLSKGKKTIIYAAIGFAVILLAQGLVFILQDLVGGGGCAGSQPFGPCPGGGGFQCIDGQWTCPGDSSMIEVFDWFV